MVPADLLYIKLYSFITISGCNDVIFKAPWVSLQAEFTVFVVQFHEQLNENSEKAVCVYSGHTALLSAIILAFISIHSGKRAVNTLCVLSGHIAPVTSCCFNADASRLATGSRDMVSSNFFGYVTSSIFQL